MSDDINHAIKAAADDVAEFSGSVTGQKLDSATAIARVRSAKELILIRGEMRGIRLALEEIARVQKLTGP